MSPGRHEGEAWRRQAQKCIAHVDLDAFYAQVRLSRLDVIDGKQLKLLSLLPTSCKPDWEAPEAINPKGRERMIAGGGTFY